MTWKNLFSLAETATIYTDLFAYYSRIITFRENNE